MNLVEKSNEIIKTVDEMVEQLKTTSAEFLTQEEYDECSDAIYDAPSVYRVSKYGTYDEYAIMKIENGVLTVIGKSETDGKLNFDISELNLGEVVYLCNCL